MSIEMVCPKCGAPDSALACDDLKCPGTAVPRSVAQPSQEWRDDPAADERWNAGCDFALEALGKYLGIDLSQVTWDGATETVEGDVDAVIGNILRAKFGEDWGPEGAAPPAPDSEPVRDALQELYEFCCQLGDFRPDSKLGRKVAAALSSPVPSGQKAADKRECTCHPDDNPPVPCPRKFAYSECVETAATAAIVDIMMGGDQAWRSRINDSDFLESADWHMAAAYAKAALAAYPPSPGASAEPPTLESVADAIDEARYRHPDHPRQRPRPFNEADRSDREYAIRLARAALLASPGPNPEANAEIDRLRAQVAELERRLECR